MQPQKVLIFGTRANPLSFFLSRNLNRRLNATNVFCVDTPETRAQNRLMPVREVFTCKELPDLEDSEALQQVIEENQITDIVDMTNVASSGHQNDTKQL